METKKPKRTRISTKPKKAELAKRKEKFYEDLVVVRNLLIMLDGDITSSGDFSRLTPENQEYWKRVMAFTKDAYELNPKYQSQ